MTVWAHRARNESAMENPPLIKSSSSNADRSVASDSTRSRKRCASPTLTTSFER